MNVAGIALGYLTDTRPNDELWMTAQMAAHFTPGTVPFLSRHGGVVIGTVDTVTADGRDLHFAGTVVDYPDLVERLRLGSIPVSIETVWGYEPLPAGVHDPDLSEPLSVTKPSFTGTLRLGTNLVGIALSERPAARGSIVWRVL